MSSAKPTTAEAGASAKPAAAPARRSTGVASNTAAKEAAAAEVPRPAAGSKKSKDASGEMKELEVKMRSTKIGSVEGAEANAKPPKELKEPKEPYLNLLPAPEEPLRPAPLLFTWGCGNSGQFGAGMDYLGEQAKPQRNKLVESMMEQGKFGTKGAGLEHIAAGGMSSLFIDEQGIVRGIHSGFHAAC